MRGRRSPDKSGVSAELIQHAGDPLYATLLEAYKEIISTGLVQSKLRFIFFNVTKKLRFKRRANFETNCYFASALQNSRATYIPNEICTEWATCLVRCLRKHIAG